MQTSRLIQAILLMLIVALAASCSLGKEYSSKLLAPRVTINSTSKPKAQKFLDFDGQKTNSEDWVQTADIKNTDSLNTSTVKLPIKMPVKTDTLKSNKEVKPLPVHNDPGPINTENAGVRTKRDRNN
jgi:hypothetical protein